MKHSIYMLLFTLAVLVLTVAVGCGTYLALVYCGATADAGGTVGVLMALLFCGAGAICWVGAAQS